MRSITEEKRAAQVALVEATPPIVKSAVLTVRFDPSDRAVFAPWTWEIRLPDGISLAGRAPDLTSAGERADLMLASYAADYPDGDNDGDPMTMDPDHEPFVIDDGEPDRCERDHIDGGVCQSVLVNGECPRPEGHR